MLKLCFAFELIIRVPNGIPQVSDNCHKNISATFAIARILTGCLAIALYELTPDSPTRCGTLWWSVNPIIDNLAWSAGFKGETAL